MRTQKNQIDADQRRRARFIVISDPDLPLLRLDREHIEEVRTSLPELPHVRRQRYVDMGVPDTDAATLTEEREVADFFEAVHGVAGDLKLSVNWVLNEVLRECRDTSISELKFDAQSVGEVDLN